jgi:hypothetical protein
VPREEIGFTMVPELACECLDRNDTTIDTWELYEEIRKYFMDMISLGIYVDIPVTESYFEGKSERQTLEWLADKWYKCRICGYLCPDFPAGGFVRKFPDGKYQKRGC